MTEEGSDPQSVPSEEWFLVYDTAADRDYYFNIQTQESRWELPEGSLPISNSNAEISRPGSTTATFDDTKTSSLTQRNLNHQKRDSSWSDMTGQMQGPFQKEQLMEWRGHFPMNTLLWTTQQITSEKEEDKALKMASFLADILDDHNLLLQWQSQTPNQINEIAPSASDYEHYLKHPTIPEAEEVEMEIQTHVRLYEDAVLAGLPPEDETAQLVDLARQSGTPLTEIRKVVEAASNDGTSQQLIVTDPYTGKMTAVASEVDEGHALYAEFGSWIDPSKLGDGLTKSAKYRREKLPSLWMKQVGYKKRVLPWQDERYDRGDYD